MALMMANRPEFHLADTAVFHLGAVPFSVYNTAAAGQIAHVLADSGCRVVVCEEQFAGRVLEAAQALRCGTWCAWTAAQTAPSPWRSWPQAVTRGSGSRTGGGRWRR